MEICQYIKNQPHSVNIANMKEVPPDSQLSKISYYTPAPKETEEYYNKN